MLRQVSLASIGDIMLELITSQAMASNYQRTVAIEGDEATVGGAVCNLAWYFSQLGRHSAVISHYNGTDRERVHQLLDEARGTEKFLVEKRAMTDLLIVAPGVKMPAIYVMGRLQQHEITAMVERLRDDGWIIFGGSRHAALRTAFLHRVATFRHAKIAFSPSYTLYEYSVEEIEEFLALSSIAFVNEHEAGLLVRSLSYGDLDAVMRLPKLGGVVTRGPQGAELHRRNSKSLLIPSVSGRQEDVIGTGEAFVCGFLHAYIAGSSWTRAAEMGCAVAARVVVDGRVRAPVGGHALPPLDEDGSPSFPIDRLAQ